MLFSYYDAPFLQLSIIIGWLWHIWSTLCIITVHSNLGIMLIVTSAHSVIMLIGHWIPLKNDVVMLRITSYKPYKFCTSLHYISLIDEFSGVKTAWSESSAACPRPWGGHRNGEKLEAGAFATLERRGPQGRAHIWVVFSCKSAEGPSRRFGYSSFVEERGSSGDASRADEPILWCLIKSQILARDVSP